MTASPRGRSVMRMITRLNVGGPARHVLILTRGLAASYPTTLVAGTPPAHEGLLEDPSVAVRHIPLVRAPNPVSDLRAMAATARLLSEIRPAIVHTHTAKAGAIGRFVASQRGGRVLVHTFHGHVLEGYFAPTAEKAIIKAERWLARRTDVLVAVSNEVRVQLLELGIGKEEQYRVIPLGLDLDPILAGVPAGALRRRLGLSPDTPLIGAVGRLAPIKSLSTLLEAVRTLPDCHLALVGDGEQRGELEATCAALDISSRVHFTGWWSNVAEVFADVDVVALSSKNEGTPVALIEAAAAGRAVVATDVGGVASVVVDGSSGLLVPASDPTSLAAALGRLLGDPELREQMGRFARSTVAPRFRSERLVEDIRALYDELLD